MGGKNEERDSSSIPYQSITFECASEDCELSHEFETGDWGTVKDMVNYYVEQGHLACARFPTYNNVRWPANPEPTGELPTCTGD